MTFQEIIIALERYWSDYGCVIFQPYDIEKGAGTLNPATFLKALGPEPWRAAYVEPSRRPTDGRYGDNPHRLGHYYQYQVIIKPAPDDAQKIYLKSLEKIGIPIKKHDVRFVEDDWESPSLGATGLGWEVWLDGMEITQFTYFQKIGTLDVEKVSLEITYGLERIAMFIQKKDSVFNLEWARPVRSGVKKGNKSAPNSTANDINASNGAKGISYGDIHHEDEVQFSKYNFEYADTQMQIQLFDMYEKEAKCLIENNLVLPAYDYILKCSHTFNILDARRAIAVSQRQHYIMRVRQLARLCAIGYLKMRKEMEYPLLPR